MKYIPLSIFSQIQAWRYWVFFKKPQNWHIGLLICSYYKELLKLFLWALFRFFPFNKNNLVLVCSGRWICSFTIAPVRSIHISRPINPFHLFSVLTNLLCKSGCHISQDVSLLSPCCALIPICYDSKKQWPILPLAALMYGVASMMGKGEIFQGHFQNCLFISFHIAYKRMKTLPRYPESKSRAYWCYSTYSWSFKLFHSQ